MSRQVEKLSPDLDGASVPGEVLARCRPELAALGHELQLSKGASQHLLAFCWRLCRALDRRQRSAGSTQVVGLQGAQGVGKTTVRRFAEVLLAQGMGRRVCGLSIDDLYLGRAERDRLARQVHPLFATRGAPGTHEVTLGLDLLRRLRHQGDTDPPLALPRFDKATDDRVPAERWPRFTGRAEIVLFEGWCVGVGPEDDAALHRPVNRLEAEDDPDGVWRRAVNARLHGDYARLFAEIDTLVVLQAPGFEVVRGWRRAQEEKLARQRPGSPGVMDAAAVDRFIMHYERLTRHALATLPAVADFVCRVDAAQRVQAIASKLPD